MKDVIFVLDGSKCIYCVRSLGKILRCIVGNLRKFMRSFRFSFFLKLRGLTGTKNTVIGLFVNTIVSNINLSWLLGNINIL